MTNLKKAAIILSLLLLGVQAFPLEKTNPKAERQVKWDNPKTKELFYKACADCHSFNTQWPWYASIAPISWMVTHNTNEGRSEFNITGKKLGEADEAAEMLLKGYMPPKPYVFMHSEADLSAEEKSLLVKGLKATFGDKKHDSESSEPTKHE